MIIDISDTLIPWENISFIDAQANTAGVWDLTIYLKDGKQLGWTYGGGPIKSKRAALADLDLIRAQVRIGKDKEKGESE